MSVHKRGSLSLSIESVIVLVLAISMLGLGLGFTKQMFDKFGSTLELPKPDMYASESYPLVTFSDIIDLDRNKATFLPARGYKSDTMVYTEDVVYLSCPFGSFTGLAISVRNYQQATDTENDFMVYIPKGYLLVDNVVCTLRYVGHLPGIVPYFEKQVTLQYKN
jgi:hypothetical protein